jgi:hypothetical protein
MRKYWAFRSMGDKNAYRSLVGKPLGNVHLEGKEEGGKTPRWLLDRCVVRISGGQNWLNILYSSRFL